MDNHSRHFALGGPVQPCESGGVISPPSQGISSRRKGSRKYLALQQAWVPQGLHTARDQEIRERMEEKEEGKLEGPGKVLVGEGVDMGWGVVQRDEQGGS